MTRRGVVAHAQQSRPQDTLTRWLAAERCVDARMQALPSPGSQMRCDRVTGQTGLHRLATGEDAMLVLDHVRKPGRNITKHHPALSRTSGSGNQGFVTC